MNGLVHDDARQTRTVLVAGVAPEVRACVPAHVRGCVHVTHLCDMGKWDLPSVVCG